MHNWISDIHHQTTNSTTLKLIGIQLDATDSVIILATGIHLK